jgi:hypothetical protein
LENRLRHIPGQGPEARAVGEHFAGLQCHGPDIGSQHKTRQPVGDGDSNLGTGGVQGFLSLAHIGALCHEL